MAKIDITGVRFANLVAVSPAKAIGQQAAWHFQCDCGTRKVIRKSHVTGGRTKSCGCLKTTTTHGLSHTRLWATWKAMKQRCSNPKTAAYHRYGGRGIAFTPEWETFEPFLKWSLENGYADDLELDRIDNDGNYEPNNCQYITHRANSQKTSACRTVILNGETISVAQRASSLGLLIGTVNARIARGWPIEKIFSQPAWSRKKGENK